MASKLLHIDDDPKIAKLLGRYMSSFGYEMAWEGHPEKGIKEIEHNTPDLVILDVMLKDINGFEVCRKIRSFSNVPVIMLSALGDVSDRVAGLEVGADDYLAKPFEPRELMARVEAILRRASKPENKKVEFGDLVIKSKSMDAELSGRKLLLTTNEFTVLKLLVGEPGKVFNRDGIIEVLGGIESDSFNRSVDITISRLRQKLGDDPKNPRYIKTIRGAGYSFIGGNQS